VSGFLSVAPKAAGFALLLRFFVTCFTLPLPGSLVPVSSLAGAGEIAFQIVGPFNWPKFFDVLVDFHYDHW